VNNVLLVVLFTVSFLVLLDSQSVYALETVVIDFDTKPDGTPIIGGILTAAEPNGLIEELDVDGEPHHLIYESKGVIFEENDLIYGRAPGFNTGRLVFNIMVGNSGEPAEGLGQAATDDIEVFFIHPITKQPRTVQSVEAFIIDPENPLTMKAFDIIGIEVDSFSNPCLDCDFIGTVSSPGGIAKVVFSSPGTRTFGIDDLTFVQEPFDLVGGELIPIETTSLILAGAQTFSWMIPVVLSVIGIGLFVVSRKSE